MKRTILLLLAAVFSVATMNAQETKIACYVIDGVQVENFDGTQLQGKTILHYSIEPKHNIHMIFTADSIGNKAIKRVKVFSYSKTDSIPLAQKYAETDLDSLQSKIKSGGIRVVKVETAHETGLPTDFVCVLDDKIVQYSEIKGLSQSKIASMTVIKDKQSAEYKKYAKEVDRDPKCIIKITTK